MSHYRSNAWAWLTYLAAISGGCHDTKTERAREQATTEPDAGRDAGSALARQQAEFEKWIKERDAVFCDPKLEVVCSFHQVTSYCDFDAIVAHGCRIHDNNFSARKNNCGGLTLGKLGAFGGDLWHYNDKFELIGASLSADQNTFCGDFGVKVGMQCVAGNETVDLCTDKDD